MSDYEALIARLEKLVGPDYLIDAEIYATIGGAPHTTTAGGRTIPLVEHGDPRDWPAYTASLDAAVALTERLLPGWTYMLNNDRGNSADLFPPNWPHRKNFDATGATMPAAIVLALLRALPSSTPLHGDQG